MANVTKEILERNNFTGDDVAFFVPHQANKRIIDATAKKVGLRDEQVVVNIDKYANTTAATIPMGIHELTSNNKIKDGDLLVIATFGAGFTWGAAVLRWGK
jgi:3-oxoacyl-[acyl-carrier-protein] synthase-3